MKKRGLFTFLVIAFLIFMPEHKAYAADFIVTRASAEAIAIIDTPVFAVPDDSAGILITFPDGTRFDIVGYTDTGWYQVEILEGIYYIPQSYLYIEESQSEYKAPELIRTASYTFETSEEGKSCFKDAINRHAENVSFFSTNLKAFDSLYAYPKIFLRSYDIKTYAEGNVCGYHVDAWVNRARYEMDMQTNYHDTIEEEMYVDALVNSMVPFVKKVGSRYNQIKAVHDYICDIANYDYEYTPAEDGRGYRYDSAFNCLVEKKAVCSGFALAFQKFMEQLEIPSFYLSNDTHAWNVVYVDGAWYQIDCTWDGQDDVTIYDFFLFSTDDEHRSNASVTISETRHP